MIKHTCMNDIEYKRIVYIIIMTSWIKSMIFFYHIVQTASTVFGKMCQNVFIYISFHERLRPILKLKPSLSKKTRYVYINQ